MRHSPLLFALLLVAAPTVSMASSSVRAVPLKKVLQRTDAVLLVSLAAPPSTEVRIPITPAGEEPDAKRWPDFIRRDRSLRVHEVLWLKDGEQPSGVLKVTGGEWSTRLTVHRRYHIEGVRKIPIFQRFAGRDGLKALHQGDGKAIVLLRREKETGWRMAAEMAFLRTQDRKRVMKRLKAKTGKKAPRRAKTKLGTRGAQLSPSPGTKTSCDSNPHAAT